MQCCFTKVAAAQAQWKRQRAETEAALIEAQVQAATLRAKRQRAREAAVTFCVVPTESFTASLGVVDHEVSPASPDQGGQPCPGTDSSPAVPDEPVLPQFGGLPGVLVGACGAQYLRALNHDVGPGVLGADAWGSAIECVQSPAPAEGKGSVPSLQGLQQQLLRFLGTPRNFQASHCLDGGQKCDLSRSHRIADALMHFCESFGRAV